MSEKSNIYEITQMLGNRQQVQSDMFEAMGSIVNVFQKKYVNKIHEVVNAHQQNVKKSPSKEIQLLGALKLFADSSMHPKIDKLIDAIYLTNAANSISKEISEITKDVQYVSMSNAYHEDGIYEIDENCELLKKQNKQFDTQATAKVILLMSLFGFI